MSEYGLLVKIVLTVGLILCGGWGSVLVVIRWARKLRVEADIDHKLKLVNMGNSRSQYYLAIKKAPPNLSFTFLVGDTPLAPVFNEEEILEEEVRGKVERVNTPSQVAENAPKDKSKAVAVKPDGALKTGKAVGEKSGVLANVLGTLGGILPGSLGKGLQKQAGKARDVQAKTAKATQAPQSAQRKMDSLKQSGGKLGVKKSKNEENLRPSSGAGTRAGRKFEPSNPSVVSSPPANNVVIKRKKIVADFVQTKDIEPGEGLLLILRVGKREKRYPVGSFGYTIVSQPMPLNKKLGEVSPTLRNALVDFEKISVWRYWMPFLSGVFVLLFTLIVVFYGLSFIWI